MSDLRLHVQLERKRRLFDGEDDLDGPPAQRVKTEPACTDDSGYSSLQDSQTQELMATSTSCLQKETIDNPDSDAEAKLRKAIHIMLNEKRNIFITGPAGSGKSYMTKGLRKELKARKIRHAIVAPSGTAAVNIGGHTIHQFFGLSPNITKRGMTQVLKAARALTVEQRLKQVEVLIIDEISMVSSEFLRQISCMAQEARGKPAVPFGGIRIVAIGDFAQLGPVKGLEHCIECGQEREVHIREHYLTCPTHGIINEEEKWAFRAKVWTDMKFRIIILDKILRQQDDKFAAIMWSLWLGNPMTDDARQVLMQDQSELNPSVRLFATRAAVDAYNVAEFEKLSTPKKHYICEDTFVLHQAHAGERWIENLRRRTSNNSLTCHKAHRYHEVLVLRVGLSVILQQNLSVSQGLVNGTQGVIIRFRPHDPTRIRTSGRDRDPLGYRYQNQDGPAFNNFTPSLGGGDSDYSLEEGRKFWTNNAANVIPVVKFSNGVVRAIDANCEVEEIIYRGGLSLKMRTQIPLTMGYASTVHRAQGMSLDRVTIDLPTTFESAQLYVALSRARTLEGLRVTALCDKHTQGHPAAVVKYLKEILPAHIKAQMHNNPA